MNLPRVLLAALVRSVVLVGVIAAYGAVVINSETTDALGTGLLAFLVLVVIAGTWALVDGVRRGFAQALLTWVVTSAVAGVGIPAVIALVLDGGDVAGEVNDGAIFFAVLLFVPAVLGLGIGAVVHRVRAPDDVIRTEQAVAPSG